MDSMIVALRGEGAYFPVRISRGIKMGLYLRKSVNVGPLRFNFSKSGIGVSTGIKGFRFGTGPRGNYIRMSCLGLSYRATLPNGKESTETRPKPQGESLGHPLSHDRTYEDLKEIESGDVLEMTDSSSIQLLDELNIKRKKARIWPLVASLGAGLIFFAANVSCAWTLPLSVLLAAAATGWAIYRDQLVKTAVLFYDFDSQMEDAYRRLHECLMELIRSRKSWHISAAGRVLDMKYHAGASHLVSRRPTPIKVAEPPYVKTNISTMAIGVGRQTLFFFPDKILVYDANGVGAVSYSDLEVAVCRQRFIEDGFVPTDTQVVGHTWQYVNKRGGPDKRFKNNRQLPVCLYVEFHLSSPSGLNEIIQISKSDIGGDLVDAIRYLGAIVGKAVQKDVLTTDRAQTS